MPSTFPLKKIVFGFLILIFTIFCWQTIASPSHFPLNNIVSIRPGAGLLEVSDTLKKDNVVRSPFWFRTSAILLGGERGLQAGDYYFPRKENVLHVAWRIVHGDKKLETVKVTIPEGFTNNQIGDLFEKKFPRFNKIDFLKNAEEGYLFPDTYFLEITTSASSSIKILNDNFKLKLTPYEPQIASSTHKFGEIIKIASILESEAQTQEDREIISGILWKRLKLNMPLQVDASLKYVLNKTSAELTKSDLEIKSPYNLYINTGLPPTPISNPGIIAIEAALHPTTTKYLYFLTDNDQKMHYAETFVEHKKNISKYLTR
jgi:UPF0755 protein